MMKTELTRKATEHLISLGVSNNKATMMPYNESKDGKFVAVVRFTLSDLLELLPKEIYSEERDITYNLHIAMSIYTSCVCYNNPSYRKGFGPMKSANELIDALYELVLWCIGNNYIKPTEQ